MDLMGGGARGGAVTAEQRQQLQMVQQLKVYEQQLAAKTLIMARPAAPFPCPGGDLRVAGGHWQRRRKNRPARGDGGR